MAKRFTNTEKWRKEWFRKLGSQGRDLWYYLHDNCDAAGFLELDLERVSFELGFQVSMDLIKTVLKDKMVSMGGQKLFFPAFIAFQYGALSESCKPHVAVMKLLQKHGIDFKTLTLIQPFPKGIHTLEEKNMDKEQEKNQEQEQSKIQKERVKVLGDIWLDTLGVLGVVRERIDATEELEICKALQRKELASGDYLDRVLFGARFEKGGAGWKASDHMTIGRALQRRDKDGVPFHQKFANLADQNQATVWVRASDAVR